MPRPAAAAAGRAADLLGRQFTVAGPDKVWASDIICIATDEGWLFLAMAIDLFSRQVVGWSLRVDNVTLHRRRRGAHGLVQSAVGAGRPG